ncbi:MAG TPA: NIPSNAP family protein [Bacteroidales bacterium]|nr:NIPSNAP family protein [Bacteroidales bacterium]
MKRIQFCRSFIITISMVALTAVRALGVPSVREYYELRIYHLKTRAQEERVDTYLRDVYIPAMHRAGILRVGVFKPAEPDTTAGRIVYLLLPFRTIDQYAHLADILQNDKLFLEASKLFVNAPFDDPPYERMETIIMKSFSDMPESYSPKFSTPPGSRIYELRAYESATEEKAVKKMEMFNQGGEIKLFRKLDFNLVFVGEVLAGSIRPNLMYMTSFADTTANRLHWKTFVDSPEWKSLSGMEEYKNTVSRIHKYFLHPAGYSEY